MKKLLLVACLLFVTNLWSHGGGLDKYGCHNEKKTGDYHCHQNRSSSVKNFPLEGPTTNSEKTISVKWCDSKGGISEFRTKDGTYVDCLTDIYAVEAEFDYNWKEAIGQSLHYAETTNKRAAILLIKRQKTKTDYYIQLERVIKKYQLPIKVFLVEKET